MLRSIPPGAVDRVVIIDNSCEEYRAPNLPEYDHLNISYIRPIINIGYGGGINAGMSQTPTAPWWMFCNADVFFGDGALAAIEQAIGQANSGPAFVATSGVNPFACSALNRELVEKVGLFDEWTFFPAYFEDNDYAYRMSLNGIEQVVIDAEVYHGDDRGPEHASATIRSSGRYREANDRSFVENERRYINKWGGLPRQETYDRPWLRDIPLSHVEIDLAGRARRSW
jgi:GT2 family glycosyltransferase